MTGGEVDDRRRVGLPCGRLEERAQRRLVALVPEHQIGRGRRGRAGRRPARPTPLHGGRRDDAVGERAADDEAGRALQPRDLDGGRRGQILHRHDPPVGIAPHEEVGSGCPDADPGHDCAGRRVPPDEVGAGVAVEVSHVIDQPVEVAADEGRPDDLETVHEPRDRGTGIGLPPEQVGAAVAVAVECL